LKRKADDFARVLSDVSHSGSMPKHRLVLKLEENGVQASVRQQEHLWRWMELAKNAKDYVWWPALVALSIVVERVSVTAGKAVRSMYRDGMQLEVMFCGEVVACPKFPWKVGMQFAEPKKTMLSPQWHAIFRLDGPGQIPQSTLARAFHSKPESQHNLRLVLSGLDLAHGGSAHELGHVDIGIGNIQAGDLDLGSGDCGSAEHEFHCQHAAGKERQLRCSVTLSTRNAVRLREACQIGASRRPPAGVQLPVNFTAAAASSSAGPDAAAASSAAAPSSFGVAIETRDVVPPGQVPPG